MVANAVTAARAAAPLSVTDAVAAAIIINKALSGNTIQLLL